MEYSEDCCSDAAGRERDFCFICTLLGFVQIGEVVYVERFVFVSLTSGSCFFPLMKPIKICGDYLKSA